MRFKLLKTENTKFLAHSLSALSVSLCLFNAVQSWAQDVKAYGVEDYAPTVYGTDDYEQKKLVPNVDVNGDATVGQELGSDSFGEKATLDYTVTGTAYNLSNNALVYRELYTIMDTNKQVRVDYVSPEGDTFATKTLSYQGAYFQPEFDYYDQRDSERLSAHFIGPKLELVHGVGDETRKKILMDNAKIVIDAGFDAYIQLNWDALIANKRLTFDFAFPARLSSVALDVRRIIANTSPLYDASIGRDWIYFKVAPAGLFISFFADPIYLAYDPKGKYLMRFQGRSNIDDNNGIPWDVRIEYEYLR